MNCKLVSHMNLRFIYSLHLNGKSKFQPVRELYLHMHLNFALAWLSIYLLFGEDILQDIIFGSFKQYILVLSGIISVSAYLDCNQRGSIWKEKFSQLEHAVDNKRQCPSKQFRSDMKWQQVTTQSNNWKLLKPY